MAAKDEPVSELISNLATLRSHNIVLKKAFLEEQKAHQQFEKRCREQEVLTNAANEKLDALKFFNTSLTQRIEQLQREINHLKKERKANWWPLSKTSQTCNSAEHKDLEQQLETSRQELLRKIAENENLQSRLFDSIPSQDTVSSEFKEKINTLSAELTNSKNTIQNLQANLENRQRLYDELSLMHSKFDTLQRQFNARESELLCVISDQTKKSDDLITKLGELWNQTEFSKLRFEIEQDMQFRLQLLGSALFKKYKDILGYSISYMDSKQTDHLLELFDAVSRSPKSNISLGYLEEVLRCYITVVKREKGNYEVFQSFLRILQEKKLDESIIMSAIQHFSARTQLWAKSKNFLQTHMSELNFVLNDLSSLLVRYMSFWSVKDIEFQNESDLKVAIPRALKQCVLFLEYQVYMIAEFKKTKETAKSVEIQVSPVTFSRQVQTAVPTLETKEIQVAAITKSSYVQTETVRTPSVQLRYAPEHTLNSIEDPVPLSSLDQLHEKQLMRMAERVRIAEARANQSEIQSKSIRELEMQLNLEREQRISDKKDFREKEESMELTYREQIQFMNDEIYKMQQELISFREKEISVANNQF